MSCFSLFLCNAQENLSVSDAVKLTLENNLDIKITEPGRAASQGLINISDTVSEVEDIKHAFRANIRAQKGIDL